jgi:endoglucanase
MAADPVRPQAPVSAISAKVETYDGGITRGPKNSKQIALVFTGHEFAESGVVVLDQLARHQAKASFFLTGDFLSNPDFSRLVRRLVKEGHYLGPHSDKHLLYCEWTRAKTTLVSRELFRSDMDANLKRIEEFGLQRLQVRYFLPPYEHYNQQIAEWAKELSLVLVNYTPGTKSHADYTVETNRNFLSSTAIFDSIVAREQQDPNGLNGFLLLLHIGAGPGRVDKFHPRFGELLDYLAVKGYHMVTIEKLLQGF